MELKCCENDGRELTAFVPSKEGIFCDVFYLCELIATNVFSYPLEEADQIETRFEDFPANPPFQIYGEMIELFKLKLILFINPFCTNWFA